MSPLNRPELLELASDFSDGLPEAGMFMAAAYGLELAADGRPTNAEEMCDFYFQQASARRDEEHEARVRQLGQLGPDHKAPPRETVENAVTAFIAQYRHTLYPDHQEQAI